MWFAILILLIVTAGGFALTYLYDADAAFFERAATGTIIGQAVFSIFGFLLGSAIGMAASVAVLALVLSAAPLLLFSRPNFKQQFHTDFSTFAATVSNFAKNPPLTQIIWATVYAALIGLLWFFFERAMFNVSGAIATGSPHNTGDLSFHLQAIYGFLDGQNLPPQNPSFAGTKFTYPFMADLIVAMIAGVGARISQVMFWQNMFLVLALIVLMRRFTFKLTGDNFAANVAPLILLLSGGLGFIVFFRDAAGSELGIFGFLMKMPDNYTIRFNSDWRWGNSLAVLFMTQRSLLLGLPIVLIVLTKIWEIFSDASVPDEEMGAEREKGRLADGERNKPTLSFLSPHLPFSLSLFLVGLLAGTLPLVHAHSFAVLMGMTGLLALMNWRRWRDWLTFFVAAGLVALPELLWAMLGSATRAKSFIDWQTGWDHGETDILYFWVKNTGFFTPLLLGAIVLLAIQNIKFKTQNRDETITNYRLPITNYQSLLLFWLPFALCFIVPNVVRLAPWVWDNIKVLIYWFAISVPLVAWLLSIIWRRGNIGKIVALTLIVGLTLAGFLDVFRIASKQIEFVVFDRDAVAFAAEVRKIMPPGARVISAPVHDSPAALTGRRWFLGFTGHVWSHGIDPNPREIVVRQIYFGDDDAEKLIREYALDYIVLSPQERSFTPVSDTFLQRFPVVAKVGDYQLLKLR